jgi:hypothetical protein
LEDGFEGEADLAAGEVFREDLSLISMRVEDD